MRRFLLAMPLGLSDELRIGSKNRVIQDGQLRFWVMQTALEGCRRA